jgi:probable F420-dependent oxidoreductase
MTTDYEFSGLPYESPGVRIEKLKETLAVLKGLWGETPFNYSGKHYTITGHDGTPKPVQQPHPPLLVGGGGKRVLRLAAREADIVGVNFVLAEGMVNPKVAVTGSATATTEKLSWIKDAAGPRMNEIELNVTVFFTFVTDDRNGMAERIAGGFGMPASDVLESPHALIGTVDQIVNDLQRRREEYGFSYIAFSGDVFDAIAPVVKRLAGT